MIPFKEIQNLVDKVQDRLKKSCCVDIEYWSWENGSDSLKYKLYIDTHEHFNTIMELKTKLLTLSNPKSDIGVKLNSKK